MKKKHIYTIILLMPFFSFSQWSQLGDDIDGASPGGGFGWSTALNADGTVMASGTSQNNDNGTNAGQTRVFDWDGDNWTQRGEAINGTIDEWTGHSVSLSDDGNTLAIGAVYAENENNIRSGLVRIYDWDGTAWSQRGNTIFGIGHPQNFLDAFGNSVSLSANGNIIAIGAPGRAGENNNVFQSGQVSVYQWNGTNWELVGDHVFGQGINEDLGFSVSLTADGTTFIAGGQGHENPNSSTNLRGRIRVYDWDGTSWNQRGEDVDGINIGDEFGKSVAISDDGNVFIAGAPGYTISDDLTCTARAFEWNGSSWIQRGAQLAGAADINGFGNKVSMSSNGTIIAIGANAFSSNGSAQVYRWDGTNYEQEGETINGEAFSDIFGSAISLNALGNILSVGAYGNDGAGQGNGHVRVFENNTLHANDVSSLNVTYAPNPTADTVTIRASEIIETITLYDVLGRELRTVTCNSNEVLLDLSQERSGQYFTVIKSKQTMSTIPVIKQ